MIDIFAVTEYDNESMSFLRVIINQLNNISNTIEKSIYTLQFLGVIAHINNYKLDKWVKRKPTKISFFFNFTAVCPVNWKSSSIVEIIYLNYAPHFSRKSINFDRLKFFDKNFIKFLTKRNYSKFHFSGIVKKILNLKNVLSNKYMFAQIQNGL